MYNEIDLDKAAVRLMHHKIELVSYARKRKVHAKCKCSFRTFEIPEVNQHPDHFRAHASCCCVYISWVD